MIRQGDKGDFFYVVERGEFDVFVADGTARRVSECTRTRLRRRMTATRALES